MRPHYFRRVGQTSPLSRKPHTKSHHRGPPRNHKPSAPIDRKRMMDDAEDCTIPMSLNRFLSGFIPRDTDGFEEKFSPDVIDKVSRALRETLTGSEEDKCPAEKNISAAWVRSTFYDIQCGADRLDYSTAWTKNTTYALVSSCTYQKTHQRAVTPPCPR